MQPSEANGPAKTMIFIGIGVVLLGLTIFGVVFAKYRADTYADQGEQQVAQQDNPASEPSAPSAEQPAENNTAGSQTTITPSSPTDVPAAGPTDTFFIALGLAASAFFATKVLQSRTS